MLGSGGEVGLRIRIFRCCSVMGSTTQKFCPRCCGLLKPPFSHAIDSHGANTYDILVCALYALKVLAIFLQLASEVL